MNILFWNLNKKDLTDIIKEIAEEYNIDVFVFCEYEINDFEFLTKLNSKSKVFQEVEDFRHDKFKIYSTFDVYNFRAVKINLRWIFFDVNIPSYPHIIFCLTHLSSKINFDEDSKSIELVHLRNDLNAISKKLDNENVVLLGDFNLNPFEKGMMKTTALHTTMDKSIALKKGRTVQNKYYNYLYNPMWNFLGDESKGKVPGTHYYRNSNHISYDWNVFDQVLYSPNLIDFIDLEDIDIVFKTNSFNLVNSNGRIDKNYSDHLPLKFKIKKRGN